MSLSNTRQYSDTIAVAASSNDAHLITAVRLAIWHPTVLRAYDFVVPNQYVCITHRGNTSVDPPESEISDDGEGPVRRGPGSTPTLPILESPSLPPTNVQLGIAPDYNRYIHPDVTVASCWKMANDADIALSSFYQWTTVLANSDSYDSRSSIVRK
ncbi:hypothetical protein LZ32DRAFT_654403 [Colletotrichum eremochloae]|nr:hypothetical protein LZ32DRAFT_654403 [Colletotrichum eremochloae]